MKPPNKLAKLLAEAMGDASKSGKLLKQVTKTIEDIDFNADMSPGDINWVMNNVKPEQLSEAQKELLYWASSQQGELSDAVDMFLYGPVTNNVKAIGTPVPVGKSPAIPLDFEETVSGIKGGTAAEKQKNINAVMSAIDPIEMTKEELAGISEFAEQIGGEFKAKVTKWLSDGPEAPQDVDVSPYMIGPLKDRTKPPLLDLTPEQAADRVNALLQTGRAADITEELYGLADPKRLRENYDLPLDPESRSQRRMEGWPGDGYHYTSAPKDFSVPRFGANATGSDTGFHFGTIQSARDRSLATLENYTDAPRYARDGKIAERYDGALQEISEKGYAYVQHDGELWVAKSEKDLNDIFKVNSPVVYPERARVIPLAYDPSAFLQVADDTGMWTPYAIARAENDVLKGSPELKAALNSLVNEQAQRRVYVNTMPEIQQAYGMDAFGNPIAKNASRLVDIESDEMRNLFNAYGVKGLAYPNRVEGYRGENSFAAFQPGTVRSTTAIFDPRLKHLGNMMAAGVPVAYGLSGSEE